MMAELLGTLLLVLKDYLVTELGAITSVQVIYEAIGQNKLHMNQLPALILFPERSSHEQGPMAMTARWRNSIRIMGITQSVDPAAYQINPTAGPTPTVRNIHAIADLTRQRLYQQKKLTGTSTFEMEPAYDVTFGMWQNLYPMFSLNVIYTSLETYTGMQNDQESLDLPPPQELPGLITFD